MKLAMIKEMLDMINEKRSGTRAPGQKSKPWDKKEEGRKREKERESRRFEK